MLPPEEVKSYVCTAIEDCRLITISRDKVEALFLCYPYTRQPITTSAKSIVKRSLRYATAVSMEREKENQTQAPSSPSDLDRGTLVGRVAATIVNLTDANFRRSTVDSVIRRFGLHKKSEIYERRWEILLAFIAIYNGLAIPFRVAFEQSQPVRADFLLDYLGDAVLVFDAWLKSGDLSPRPDNKVAPEPAAKSDDTSAPESTVEMGLISDKPDSMVRMAITNFERYHGLLPGKATLDDIQDSAARIAGWAAMPASSARAKASTIHASSQKSRDPATFLGSRLRAIMDVVAAIPFELLMSWTSASRYTPALMAMFRLNKLLKLHVISQLIPEFKRILEERKGTVYKTVLPVVGYLLRLIFVAHWFACGWALLATLQRTHRNWTTCRSGLSSTGDYLCSDGLPTDSTMA